MDAHQYGIGLSILGQQIHHQLLRKDPIPSFTLVELGDRLAISWSYVLIKQFSTGMGCQLSGGLPPARRVCKTEGPQPTLSGAGLRARLQLDPVLELVRR